MKHAGQLENMYPWQHDQWKYFANLIKVDAMPHAILLGGPAGVGKLQFANMLCSSILCTKHAPGSAACGKCKHCMLFLAGTYPDFTRIAPEEAGGVIAIDYIRGLIDRLNLTRHFDKPKIALIESADGMNISSSNALLKTLEEPPEDTVIILVTDHPQKLVATVRSRCQTVIFNVPVKDVALDWLQQIDQNVEWEPLLAIAQGAPLQAVKLYDTDLLDQRTQLLQGLINLFESKKEPMELASILDSISVTTGIHWIQGMLLDLMRLKSAENPITLENPDFYRSLLAITPHLEVPLLLDLWDWLLQRKRIFDNSLNRRLFVEDLLLHCRQLTENIK